MKNLLFFTLICSSSLWAQDNSVAHDSLRRLSEIDAAIAALGDIACVENHDHSQDEDQNETQEGFPRVTARLENICERTQARDGYGEKTGFDCSGQDPLQLAAGFQFKSKDSHPHFKDVNPYGTISKPYRQIEVRSMDHALNETYLYLADISNGPDSHDVKSKMFLLPRKSPPTVLDQGSKVELTLSTGEKVTFEKSTGAIVGGALKESPPDFNLDRFKRKPPQVDYAGSGISIRLSHRYEDPTQASPTADVVQGSRSCKLPREKIFNASGKLITTSDASLVKAINSSCPAKAGQKPFSF